MQALRFTWTEYDENGDIVSQGTEILEPVTLDELKAELIDA